MNLLFLSPRRLIPPCTCSVTPAGAARICKHSWCVSASERSHLTSPRRSSSSPRMPRITQIHVPGGGRGTCSWCRLIRGAQCFCQTFCWKSYRNEVTQGARNLVHFFRPCEPRSVFSLSWFFTQHRSEFILQTSFLFVSKKASKEPTSSRGTKLVFFLTAGDLFVDAVLFKCTCLHVHWPHQLLAVQAVFLPVTPECWDHSHLGPITHLRDITVISEPASHHS